MDAVKCWKQGIESDQGYQNYLFYNGHFNTNQGNATLFLQGEGVVNTIGALNGYRYAAIMSTGCTICLCIYPLVYISASIILLPSSTLPLLLNCPPLLFFYHSSHILQSFYSPTLFHSYSSTL